MANNTLDSLKTPFLQLHVLIPITSLGVFMGAMDGSIVNVALFTMIDALNTDRSSISWVVIVYLLITSALMAAGGSLGDIYGRKKVFQLGLLLFVCGSLLCSLSSTLVLLVISRGIQAIGAAGLIANGLAIVMTFVNPVQRGRAIGFNSFVVASALAAGPVLGGILTQYVGWQSIFLINIPIGILAIILTQLKIPETPRKENNQLDYLGIALFALGIMSLVGGIRFYFENYSWGKTVGAILVIITISSLILFVFHESKHGNPMISIKLMKTKKIAFGATAAFCSYMALNGMTYQMSFYFQDVWKFNQSTTGMLLLVSPIVMSVTGVTGGYLAEKIDARKLATTGTFFLTTSLLCVAVIMLIIAQNPVLSIGILISIVILIAINSAGLSIFNTANGTSVMGAAPKAEISIVSGILNLSRTTAFTMSTTISTACFETLYRTQQVPVNNQTLFISAYHQSLGSTFLIFVFIGIGGMILSASRGKSIPNS